MDNPYGISSVLRILIPCLYLATAAGYIAHFAQSSKKLYTWVKPVFLSGIVLHLILFIILFYRRGTIPLSTVFEGLFFCSLILSALYLLMEHVVKETCYGAFLLPVNFIISVIATVYLYTGKQLPDSMNSVYFISHASFLLTAYACFFLSFIISVMYLLQFNEIKKRHLGHLFKRLPALENMDISVARLDALGLSLLFLGIVVGFLWLDLLPDNIYRMHLKIGFTVLAGIVYLFEHLMRVAKGWKGQRATMVSIAGFIFILITLFVGRHGY
jgi:ABC-type uncharacterized transport system permease subunit